MMFHCKLIDRKGYQLENFYREGTSEREVQESLDAYEWPEGEWIITETGQDMEL